jgi:DNA-binding winged helix-turn-helix (wHTH) protein/TolB-like protein
MQRDPTAELVHPVRLALGACVLDLERGELLDAHGEPSTLRAQALAVLCALGRRAGEVVTKEELMRRVWGDVIVTEDSLVQAVGDIRRVLGESGHRVVRTVPRRGYLLQVEVATKASSASGAEEVPASAETSQAPQSVATGPAPSAQRSLAPPASSAVPVPVALPREPSSRWPMRVGAMLLLLLLATAAGFSLRWTPAAPPLRSLAILPFETEGLPAADDWLAAGITGDLNSHAARWHGVTVIGFGTMRSYRGRVVDPRTVAAELGVQYVLTGRLRREPAAAAGAAGDASAERVRLAVQLIDGATGAAAWTQLIDVERADLPGSIGDLAGGLARALMVEWGLAIGERRARLAPDEAQAEDLSMQGFGVYLRGVGPDHFAQALHLFEQALAKDPDSRRALAGVSMSHGMSLLFGWAPDRAAAAARAEQALARLESLDPHGHLTLLSRATLTNYHNDWTGLLALGDTLVREFPNEPSSHHNRCSALLRLARFDESILACERALRISPRDSRAPTWNGLIGMSEYMRGRPAAAAERARAMVLGNPRVPFYSLLLAAALMDSGGEAQARQAIDAMRERHPDFSTARAGQLWPVGDAAFIAGRDRILVHARALGVP